MGGNAEVELRGTVGVITVFIQSPRTRRRENDLIKVKYALVQLYVLIPSSQISKAAHSSFLSFRIKALLTR